MHRTNRNASHQTYCSTVKATFTFGGRCTTGCRCHGGGIGVVCHGESHPKITELRRCVRYSSHVIIIIIILIFIIIISITSPAVKLISWIFNHSKRAYRRWDIVDHKCTIRVYRCCASTDMVLLQSLNIENNQLSGTIPVLDQSYLHDINLSVNYLTMGSLEAVPLSTFSTHAPYSKFIVLKSNCLVFRNPGKPSENVDATHCRSERVLPNRYCLWFHNTYRVRP